MDHMRIWGTEPSSVILSQTKSSVATLPLRSFIRGGIDMLLQDLVNLRANFQKSWLLF